MKKSTKAKLGGAVLAVSMLPSLVLGCNETPNSNPEPLPKLVVENFKVELKIPTYTDANGLERQVYPVETHNAEASWDAITAEGYEGMSITNGNAVYNADKTETSKTIEGVTGTDHTFTATPKGAAGQDVTPASVNASVEPDERDRNSKLDAWLKNPIRKEIISDSEYISPLPEETINIIKEVWSNSPVDTIIIDTDGWISKAITPKDKFIANKNRMAKAVVKNSSARMG